MSNVVFKSRWASEWELTNPILRNGEPGFDRSVNRLKVGDGHTPWSRLNFVTGNQRIDKLEDDVDFVATIESFL